jgi:hypothetical protein
MESIPIIALLFFASTTNGVTTDYRNRNQPLNIQRMNGRYKVLLRFGGYLE